MNTQLLSSIGLGSLCLYLASIILSLRSKGEVFVLRLVGIFPSAAVIFAVISFVLGVIVLTQIYNEKNFSTIVKSMISVILSSPAIFMGIIVIFGL